MKSKIILFIFNFLFPTFILSYTPPNPVVIFLNLFFKKFKFLFLVKCFFLFVFQFPEAFQTNVLIQQSIRKGFPLYAR